VELASGKDSARGGTSGWETSVLDGCAWAESVAGAVLAFGEEASLWACSVGRLVAEAACVAASAAAGHAACSGSCEALPEFASACAGVWAQKPTTTSDRFNIYEI